jgi:hypothetical protein
LKSLQNFVKNFEKVLNGFEFKRFELKEFEKREKKKRPHLSFNPQRPTGPSSFFRGSPCAVSPFLFPCVADRAVPPVGASSSSRPPSFPLFSRHRPGHHLAPRLLRFPLPSVGFNQEP